jgi:HK97 family phage prohead protease
MNKICFLTKDKEIEYETHEDYIKWFENNINEKGVVTEDVIIFSDVETKSIDDVIQFNMSSMEKDRDNERIDPKGWDLKSYLKNPVILWSHDKTLPSIGVMENVRIENGTLVGEAKFVPKEIDEWAWGIGERVKQGFLTKGSVGFIPKKIELIKNASDGTKLIHREQELLEYSIVNVPALPSSGVKSLSIFDKSDVESDYMDTLFKGTQKTSGLEDLFKG